MQLTLLCLVILAIAGVACSRLPQHPFLVDQSEAVVTYTEPSATYKDSPLQLDAIISSTYDKSLWISDVTSLYSKSSLQFVPLANRSSNAPVPNVIPSSNQRLQRFFGWGVAITDSTSVVLQSMHDVNETYYWEILRLLFDPSEDTEF